ncbi:MAG: ACT domain-containing protein [Pirellulales bacterium]
MGIDTLATADLLYAKELGYRIKLVADARLSDGKLQIHVSPHLVKHGTPLAEVRGAHNAITVEGNAVGRLLFHGLGAGQMPTASAVLADTIDMVNGRAKITFQTLELWKQHPASFAPADFNGSAGKFYLRFNVADRPGVMAEITSALGKNGVSIASIIQHESAEEEGVVPLVIMTHTTTEGAIGAAFEEIAALSSMKSLRGPDARVGVA